MDNKNNRSSIGGSTGIMLGMLAVVGLIGSFLWLPSYMPVIFPPQASLEAKSIDGLFQILLIIGGIVFFLIQGLLVISVIAFRKPANDDSDGVANHGNMTIEIVWTIIPAIIVTFLAIMSFNVWQDNTEPKANINMVDGDPITLNVVGARYAWTHTYVTNELDDDGNPYVLNTGTDLHVYVGQNVLLTLQTQDVLHSYWVPAMRVKQDLLPGDPNNGGRPTELRFTVAELDEEDERIAYNKDGNPIFPIVCAELCGDGHSRMRGDVIVHESLDAYVEDFYAPTLDAVINPPPDPVLRGQAAIQTYACSGCHVLNDADAGIAWSGPTGPPLDGIADRAGGRGRVSGQSAEEYLVTSIWNSGAYLAPGYQNLMPAFGPDIVGSEMTGEQLYSIVAYLCTQGEESTCDNENNMTVIPEAIFNVFGVEVDGTFGLDASDASAESTAEPDAESTDEPEAEATAEADD